MDLHTHFREHSEPALHKGKLQNLTFDAYLVSVTKYDALSRQHPDLSKYTRKELAEMRQVFADRNDDYDVIKLLLRAK